MTEQDEQYLKLLLTDVAAANTLRGQKPDFIPYLYQSDLRMTDLRGADLWGVYLHGASLHGANLNGADLSWAKFNGAYLHGVNLGRANFHRAYLSGATVGGRGFVPPPSWEDLSEPGLGERIAKHLLDHPKTLRQDAHTCETVHCLGGFSVAMSPRGRELQQKYSTSVAAAMLWPAAATHFFDSNEEALACLRETYP